VTKADNREQKIRRNTKNVSLEDFEWLICRYGYIKAGGHHPVAFIGKQAYPYPKNNPVQQNYVKGVLELIDKEGK
jgi:hypothetical protein